MSAALTSAALAVTPFEYTDKVLLMPPITLRATCLDNKKCFLDMDGVLADFMFALCEAHGRTDPYENPPFARGIFDTEKVWGISAAEFWDPVNALGEEFWRRIPKTKEADEIVDLASRYFGEENVAILTNPSNDPGSVPGKRWWVKKYYPQFVDRMIFGSCKEFMASPRRVLFDDRDKNINAFRAAGGRGITVPRLWNCMHEMAEFPMAHVRAALYGRDVN